MQNITITNSNRFSFVCPVFNTETEFRACNTLRTKVYRGEHPDVRKGCQVCMSAGKCPVAHVVGDFAFRKGEERHGDDFASVTPKKGKITARVLERIAAVMIFDSALTQSGCSASERKLIETANDRILQQLESAPNKAPSKSRVYVSSDTKTVARGGTTVKAKPKTSDISSAAASGDMSAAINQGS